MPKRSGVSNILYISRRWKKKTRDIILLIVLIVGTLLSLLLKTPVLDGAAEFITLSDEGQYVLNNIDVTTFKTEPVIVNGNRPFFDTTSISPKSYEDYSSLDFLGRCGPANAVLGKELMPKDGRENIGSVKPSGWNNKEYPEIATACEWDQTYWANRCHLIAFALAGENANEQNLITGTRMMNLNMLFYESELIDYIRSTKNHVRYRVTPVFMGSEMVARGVLLEAYSIEDYGEGVCFNVWIPNTQNCIAINYRTGDTSEYDTVTK